MLQSGRDRPWMIYGVGDPSDDDKAVGLHVACESRTRPRWGELGRYAALRQKSMLESLMANVAFSVAERCLLESHAPGNSRCGEGLEIEARAQEYGAVMALPMQVMCKQWNRQGGTEYVRIILILKLALLAARVDPPWLLLTGGLADNLEALHTGILVLMTVLGPVTLPCLLTCMCVGETNFLFGDGGDDKTARNQSWAWKGLGNSKDIDGNRTAVSMSRCETRTNSNRPDEKVSR